MAAVNPRGARDYSNRTSATPLVGMFIFFLWQCNRPALTKEFGRSDAARSARIRPLASAIFLDAPDYRASKNEWRSITL
jgi:hypothetical protein